MCEVLDSYINRGIKIGISQGISRGISQGIETERALAIQRLIDAKQSEEFILSLGYTAEEVAHAKNRIKCVIQ